MFNFFYNSSFAPFAKGNDLKTLESISEPCRNRQAFFLQPQPLGCVRRSREEESGFAQAEACGYIFGRFNNT